MRRDARTDANHAEVVKAFRSMGCLVLSLAPIGRDVPDLLVKCNGRLCLVEVKDGKKPPSSRRMSIGQQAFADEWGTILITSLYDVSELVSLMRSGND